MHTSISIPRRAVFKGIGAVAAAGVLGGNARLAFAAAPHLRAAITGYSVINTLDPGKATLIPEFYVIWSLYNGLLTFDDKMNIVPDLAESYKTLEDGSIEFKLRKGVKFHDGSEMTSDDVKFSIERILNESFASPNRAKVAAVDRVDAVDPLTVRIYTKRPFAPLLTFLTNSRTGTQIVPRKAVEAMGAEAFARKPIGTGPYKLESWSAGTGLKLAAHKDYFGGAPTIETVDVPLIAEESSGVTALLGNQIDLTSTVPAADVPQLSTNPNATILKQPGLNMRFLSLNLRKAPFDDPHFRRAVSMAFQREAMVNAVIFGEGATSHGIFPPLLGDYFSNIRPPQTLFDPQAAKAEMAKSRYKPGEQTVAVVTWGGSWWKRFAEIFVAQVNQTLGTKFTVEVTDANAAYARQQSGDFVCSVWGWLGLVDPDEYINDIFHSKGWRNFGGYSNPEADTLIEAAAREMDQAKRVELYHKAEKVVMEDLPFIPCFTSNIHNLLRKGVSGFVQKPYSNFGDQFINIKTT
ncbi:Peptide/nickel ABC transporter substrate-binding protein [Hyphomicrobiales bacterium]|nr:Peptide/nickel ABC transporter substrate-binding protein [Hyphomicrobiales bacterium]CAH1695117.1 Peptide/nickel ABC transporter substrate-binding protein [Hyphomicrobiales bacterium]